MRLQNVTEAGPVLASRHRCRGGGALGGAGAGTGTGAGCGAVCVLLEPSPVQLAVTVVGPSPSAFLLRYVPSHASHPAFRLLPQSPRAPGSHSMSTMPDRA